MTAASDLTERLSFLDLPLRLKYGTAFTAAERLHEEAQEVAKAVTRYLKALPQDERDAILAAVVEESSDPEPAVSCCEFDDEIVPDEAPVFDEFGHDISDT